MATWFDKLSKVAQNVVDATTTATSKTIQTYKDNGLSGLVDKTEEVFGKAVDSTQSYLKDIGQSNKEVMTEAEKNVGKGTISGKIASGLAATVHTTQIVADDITGLGKKVLKTFTSDENSVDKVGNIENVGRNIKVDTKSTDPLQESVNLIPIEQVLVDIMSAKKSDNNVWVDSVNVEYQIHNESWFSAKDQAGGKNAVSLLSYHLAKLGNFDYNKQSSRSQLQHEAVNILNAYKVSQIQVEPPKAAKKTSSKQNSTKSVVAKNEAKAVDTYTKAGVVKKTAVKKTTTKNPEVVSKPEAAAVKRHAAKKVATKAPAKTATKTVAQKAVAKKTVSKPKM